MKERTDMHWLIFNFVSVMLSALILPSIVRFILKRPVNRIASVFMVGVNVLLVVMLWVFLQSALLPDAGGRSTPTYLLLGVTLGMFTGWAILTKQENRFQKKAVDE